MKFAFLVDTSPLMQLKSPLVLQSDPQNFTGMTFFEQSTYSIEEFIVTRRKLGKFAEDKYFLALTAASPEHNVKTEPH